MQTEGAKEENINRNAYHRITCSSSKLYIIKMAIKVFYYETVSILSDEIMDKCMLILVLIDDSNSAKISCFADM